MSEPKLKPRQFLPFYGLWLISAVLSIADWLVLRAAATAIAAAIANSVPMEKQIAASWYLRWVVGAVDKFAWLILGIIAMLSVMAFEFIYRTGLIRGKIKKRFIIVTAIQVGILLLSALAIGVSSRVV